MAKSKGKGKRPTAQKRLKPRAPRAQSGYDAKLLNLIVDPCQAELTTGYAMTTTGLVQRFTRFIAPAAASENNFAYVWNPTAQHGNAVYQKLSTGSGAATNTFTSGPGEAFIESNADTCSTLAACMEILYTGKLVDRRGYIGVCQANANVMADISAGTTDLPTLLTYCQSVMPVPSHKVELKWSPSLRNFTAANATGEGGSGADNYLMVVAVGVNPNDFVVRFTAVYEYAPKFTLGAPASRVTKQIPPAVGEHMVSALDRMGTWWHNLGNAAAAATRMGYSAAYGAGQAARFAATSYRTVRQLAALEPATALLALAG